MLSTNVAVKKPDFLVGQHFFSLPTTRKSKKNKKDLLSDINEYGLYLF